MVCNHDCNVWQMFGNAMRVCDMFWYALYIRTYVRTYVRMYVCMSVMYVCHVCMYVCMYVGMEVLQCDVAKRTVMSCNVMSCTEI